MLHFLPASSQHSMPDVNLRTNDLNEKGRHGSLEQAHHGPEESVVTFEPSRLPSNAHCLTQAIFNIIRQPEFSLTPDISRLALESYRVLSQLGPYCADRIWQNGFQTRPTEVLSLNSILQGWQYAPLFANAECFQGSVSPKVVRLLEVLDCMMAYKPSSRCIIYVQTLAVARLLYELLKQTTKYTYSLVEDSTIVDVAQHSMSPRARTTLIVPECFVDVDISLHDVVIRFDVTPSQLSYLYTKSMASDYLIHMVQNGNAVENQMLARIRTTEKTLVPWVDAFTNNGNTVPPIPLYEVARAELYVPESGEFLLDPVAGGKITEASATRVIYQLAASVPLEHEDLVRKLFSFNQVEGEDGEILFQCSIRLPKHFPIRPVVGHPYSTLARSRRAACFQTCRLLFKQGILNYRFFPSISLPAADEGCLLGINNTLNANSEGNHPRRLTAFWERSLLRTEIQLELFVTLVQIESFHSAPIALLTRQPLPSLCPFNLLEESVSFRVNMRQAIPIQVDTNELELLRRYTIRACRAVMNRRFVCNVNEMPYFLAPVVSDTLFQNEPNALQIAWDAVRLTIETWVQPLNMAKLDADSRDAVVQDSTVEFTRKFYVVELMRDMNPFSTPEEGTREAGYKNYAEYCKTRSQRYNDLSDFGQPLLRVDPVPSNVNYLVASSKAISGGKQATTRYLIPQLCVKLSIPARTFRALLFFPSIARKIDDLLVLKELNATVFCHAIREDLLLAAVTPPAALLEYDYERLEFLGDTFLKYISTTYLFVTAEPNASESQLHHKREELVSNKALLRGALSLRFTQYIQARPFNHKQWKPFNFLVQPDPPKNAGKIRLEDDAMEEPAPEANYQTAIRTNGKFADNGDTQRIGDKVVADVVEAIIGAAYITDGDKGALKAIEALNIPIPGIDSWANDARRLIELPRESRLLLRHETFLAVEAIMGVQIERPHFLEQALMHAPRIKRGVMLRERLEFLGDAVLDCLIVRYLFMREGDVGPGLLSMLKSAMVSNATMAALCVASGLYHYVHSGNPAVMSSIQTYADRLRTAQREEYEASRNQKRRPGQYWVGLAYPKVLADTLEATIGAIYVSAGFSFEAVESCFTNTVRPFVEMHIRLETLEQHPMKLLCEFLQGQGCRCFQLVKRPGLRTGMIACSVVVHGETLVSAEETNAFNATKRVAELALTILTEDRSQLKRVCNCRANAQAHKSQKKVLKGVLHGFEGEEELQKILGAM